MIQVRALTLGYGNKVVIRDAQFDIEKGQAVVLAGENGSGKSTLLAALAGVLSPQSGSIQVNGKLAYIPQGSGLIEELTFADNLRFFASVAAKHLPETLPLGAEKLLKIRIRDMSGGMKKLCSIVCALIQRPDVLLLDEPCASLDAEHRDLLSEHLCLLKRQGVTLVYVGHDEQEYAAFADRILSVTDTVEDAAQ